MTGAVYPSFGIVFGKAINSFSDTDPHQRRHDGDRNALYFFIIALISTLTIGVQNYMFGSTSASLSGRLRELSFKAILRQDGTFPVPWCDLQRLLIHECCSFFHSRVL